MRFKSLPLKKLVQVSAMIVLSSLGMAASAQDQVGAFVEASKGDGNKILQAYLNPYLKRNADGWADGWTYTAKHEKFTVKLVSVSASFTDNGENTYDASKIGLSSAITFRNSPINPTITGGPNSANAIFDVHGKDFLGGDHIVASINGPDGIKAKLQGKSFIPTIVTPQIGFGISKNTEIMIRLVPAIQVGKNVNASVYGLGIKETLTDLIFGPVSKLSKKLAPMDIAAYMGYSTETLGYKLNVQPTDADKTSSGNQNTDYSSQRIKMRTTNFTIGAIASKTILFITPHAGFAYTAASTNLAALGTYPVTVNGAGKNGSNSVTNMVDPFAVSGAHNGASANFGVNINLFLIKINTDYIISKYNRLNVGLSLFF